MIESAPSTTAQNTVMGLIKQQVKKNRMEWGNSDVPRFQYKVTVFLHLKMFTWLCVKPFFRSHPYKNQALSEIYGKICQNLTPFSRVHFFLSTTKHLRKIRLHMIFTVLVNSLKKFFSKPKFNCFKKNSQFFSYSLLPKILKLTMPSLRLVVVVKIVTSFYFLRVIDYGIKKEVPYDIFPPIWNSLYLVSSQATKSQTKWGQLKFCKVWNKKGSVKKRKTSIKRTRVFQIA